MATTAKTTILIPMAGTPVLAAASLVTAILKHSASPSLAALYQSIQDQEPKVLAKLSTLLVTEEQLELIESHGDVVSLLRTGPSTSITECNGCGKTSVAVAASTKCALTLGCGGTPIKSTAATKPPVKKAEPPAPE